MWIKLLGIGLATLLLAGCLGGAGTSTTGTLALHLGDSGAQEGDISSLALDVLTSHKIDPDEVAKVLVTIEAIEIKGSGGWHRLDTTSERVDLMDLLFQPIVLVEESLTADTYTQLRLILDGADDHEIWFNGQDSDEPTRIEPLKVPSGKLQLKNVQFDIRANALTALVLDVNTHYIVERGNSGKGYILNPVQAIRVVPMSEFGTIELSWELPEAWTNDFFPLVLEVYKGELDVHDSDDWPDPVLTREWDTPVEFWALAIISPGTYTFVLTASDDDEAWMLFGIFEVEPDGNHSLTLTPPDSNESED